MLTTRPYSISRLLITGFGGLLLIVAINPLATANPCLVEPQEPSANAGCLAFHQGRMLVIVQRDRRWSIPGGTSRPGENARCTAYRETLEETGLRMQVGQLLEVGDNGFHIFSCQPQGDHQPEVRWYNPEVREAAWAQPDEIPAEQWRYPNQLPRLLELGQVPAPTP